MRLRMILGLAIALGMAVVHAAEVVNVRIPPAAATRTGMCAAGVATPVAATPKVASRAIVPAAASTSANAVQALKPAQSGFVRTQSGALVKADEVKTVQVSSAAVSVSSAAPAVKTIELKK